MVQDNGTPAAIGQGDMSMRTATTIIKETTDAMNRMTSVYQKVGLAGTLTIASIVITTLVIALSFVTGVPEEGGGWHAGVDVSEEILFGVMAGLFACLATIALIYRNGRELQKKLKLIEIERERNQWIHEETLAKLRVPGSKTGSPPPEPEEHGNQGEQPGGFSRG